MKLHTLALVAAFSAFGVSAEAQTCSALCGKNFWQTASQGEIVAELSKVDVNARSVLGYTALIWAAAFGTDEHVKLLLDAGADVNSWNDNGRTALMFAVDSQG
jgi:hypothetical protein